MNKILTRVDYKNGQLWIDKEAKIQSKQLVWFANKPRITDDFDERFLIWNFRFEDANISAIDYPNYEKPVVIVAQSTNLSLSDIPYVEIEEKENLFLLAKAAYEQQVASGNGIPKMADYTFGWAAGYKAASAKKYTEEDLRKALHMADNEYFKHLEHDDIIQSLQPKVVSIEIEIRGNNYVGSHHIVGGRVYKSFEPVTYQKDGKMFLKVKKVNYE